MDVTHGSAERLRKRCLQDSIFIHFTTGTLRIIAFCDDKNCLLSTKLRGWHIGQETKVQYLIYVIMNGSAIYKEIKYSMNFL